MKRFSVTVFMLVALLHIFGTDRLIRASMLASKAIDNGQAQPSLPWLKIWSWIWQPIPMCLRLVRLDLTDNIYYAAITLTWSLCVAVCFGFLVPRLFRWRRRTA